MRRPEDHPGRELVIGIRPVNGKWFRALPALCGEPIAVDALDYGEACDSITQRCDELIAELTAMRDDYANRKMIFEFSGEVKE